VPAAATAPLALRERVGNREVANPAPHVVAQVGAVRADPGQRVDQPEGVALVVGAPAPRGTWLPFLRSLPGVGVARGRFCSKRDLIGGGNE